MFNINNHDTTSSACEGNICVNDLDNSLRIWFPDEFICSYRPQTKWIKNQKKIQKLCKAGKISNDKYFTLAMLERMKVIRAGITGIDPQIPLKGFRSAPAKRNQIDSSTKRYQSSSRDIEAVKTQYRCLA